MLNGQRENLKKLANELANSAADEFSLGNDAEAIELLRDIRTEARALQNRADLLRVFDLSATVDDFGLHRLLSITMGLGSPGDRSLRPALKALRDDLLDESDFNSGRVRAIEGDRMLSLDMLPRRTESWPPIALLPGRPVIEWMLHPMFVRKFMDHNG